MNLRNLEQIQEQSRPGGFPLGTLFLSALAGGALVVTLIVSLDRDAPPTQAQADPLQELLDKVNDEAQPAAMVVDDKNVTFPKILSDDSSTTTALAAVKDERGRMLQQLDVGLASGTAIDGSSLPKTPLPAGDLLSATSVTTDPKDELSQLARSRIADGDEQLAPPGQQGGYEIQVASFQDPADADAFVEQLRKRGHSAYRQAAYVPERGLWHRVRIGPFKYKYKAAAYQKKLDEGERISSFLVDPEKVKRQEAIRDAKLEARERKKARRRGRAIITPAGDD